MASARWCRYLAGLAAATLAGALSAAAADARVLLSGGSFGGGFTSPMVVLVHLALLLTLGLWAADQGGRAAWQLPVVAAAAAVAAGVLGGLGVRLPFTGEGLALSLIVLGALVALAVKAPAALAILVAAVAAVFYGHAYAGAARAATVPALFWVGFAAATLLLAAAGIGLAVVVGQGWSKRGMQAIGWVMVVLGVLDLLGMV
jgi:urease accessory protein